MPDISMCFGGGCPRREECYRYTAEPNPWRQSYFAKPPIDQTTKVCDYFAPDYSKKEADEPSNDL